MSQCRWLFPWLRGTGLWWSPAGWHWLIQPINLGWGAPRAFSPLRKNTGCCTAGCSAGLSLCNTSSQREMGLCFSTFAREQKFISMQLISPLNHLDLLQCTAECSWLYPALWLLYSYHWGCRFVANNSLFSKCQYSSGKTNFLLVPQGISARNKK